MGLILAAHPWRHPASGYVVYVKAVVCREIDRNLEVEVRLRSWRA